MKWKKGEITREKYIEERGKMKKIFKEKQSSKREEEEAELRSIKREADVWKFINKRRKKKAATENNIETEE